jgi:AraC-like DNA-binding protein
MADQAVLDNLLRGVAAGGFTVSGAVLALAPVRAPARWIGVAFFLCAIGHVLDNDAALRGAAEHVNIAVWLLSALGPATFWLFTTVLFTDERAFPPLRLVPVAVSLALSLAASASPAAHIAYVAFSAALVVHAFFVIWQGWKGDLVERRRMLRAPVLAAGAAYVLIVAVGEFGHVVGLPVQTGPLFQAFALALLSLAAGLTLLRVDAELFGPSIAARPEKSAADPADTMLLAGLERVLSEEEIWRRENLTIGTLATHLAVPEHRLRRLINGALGYRNFAALINERRIAAAKTALAANPREPVSAIAFALGYGSLGPFNRAFKDATGLTPTAWRLSPEAEIPRRD